MNFNPKTWQPVAIDHYERVTGRDYILVYSTDRQVYLAKPCPTSKPLYCSRDGHFFSLTNNGTTLQEIKPHYTPGMQNYKGGSIYPQMRHFGGKSCHHLMYETWVGPRTKGMEIDHIDGNKMNWSLDNLEEVTPAENRKRAKILRSMRAAGNDPEQYSPARLKNIFASYELMDGDTQMKREMSRHCEL